MTIGMLIESMAGKSGALHGEFQDATTFSFDEEHPAGEYFGEQLAKAGYNYYGNEVMYSGTTGVEFKAEIYLGTVYYQRLRHMVKDKYQVRSHGPVNPLTMQPVKGRKRGGGVRFGEMERDSLLSHGTSFLLKDRLMNSSDAGKAYCCEHCGSILAPTNTKVRRRGLMASALAVRGARRDNFEFKQQCRNCKRDDGIVIIPLPYVFRYLTTELAAMNIKMTLNLDEQGAPSE
jgi:DNA-directed RNA polymerase I subunit RPA2